MSDECQNKVCHFCHYHESHGSGPIGEKHSDLRQIKADAVKQPYLLDSFRPSDLNMPGIKLFWYRLTNPNPLFKPVYPIHTYLVCLLFDSINAI